MAINYVLVSEAAILRDFTDPEYKNEEHKRLTDIADSLYNTNIPVSEWGDNPEYNYKELYKKYDDGKFWQLVLRDMAAIDDQATGSRYHTAELIEEYKELIKE